MSWHIYPSRISHRLIVKIPASRAQLPGMISLMVYDKTDKSQEGIYFP